MTLHHHAFRYCEQDIRDLLQLLSDSYALTGALRNWSNARLEGWFYGPKARRDVLEAWVKVLA